MIFQDSFSYQHIGTFLYIHIMFKNIFRKIGCHYPTIQTAITSSKDMHLCEAA